MGMHFFDQDGRNITPPEGSSKEAKDAAKAAAFWNLVEGVGQIADFRKSKSGKNGRVEIFTTSASLTRNYAGQVDLQPMSPDADRVARAIEATLKADSDAAFEAEKLRRESGTDATIEPKKVRAHYILLQTRYQSNDDGPIPADVPLAQLKVTQRCTRMICWEPMGEHADTLPTAPAAYSVLQADARKIGYAIPPLEVGPQLTAAPAPQMAMAGAPAAQLPAAPGPEPEGARIVDAEPGADRSPAEVAAADQSRAAETERAALREQMRDLLRQLREHMLSASVDGRTDEWLQRAGALMREITPLRPSEEQYRWAALRRGEDGRMFPDDAMISELRGERPSRPASAPQQPATSQEPTQGPNGAQRPAQPALQPEPRRVMPNVDGPRHAYLMPGPDGTQIVNLGSDEYARRKGVQIWAKKLLVERNMTAAQQSGEPFTLPGHDEVLALSNRLMAMCDEVYVRTLGCARAVRSSFGYVRCVGALRDACDYFPIQLDADDDQAGLWSATVITAAVEDLKIAMEMD